MIILCYHSISDLRQDDLAVRIDDFRYQIEYLLKEGYENISLKEYYDILQNGDCSSNRKFALTFDDGYADNYFNAFPILKERNLKATIFLITDYIGTERLFKPEKYMAKFRGTPDIYRFLNWDQVREMKEWGISFGSHSCSHPILTEVSLDEARKEIIDSKSIIEKNTGGHVGFICYPSGAFNDSIIDIVKRSGYEGGVVTSVSCGVKNKSYTLKRVSVYRADKRLKFRIKIFKGFNIFREAILCARKMGKR